MSVEIDSGSQILRLQSGDSVCIEGLVSGRWVTFSRTLAGRRGAGCGLQHLSAFEIELLESPKAGRSRPVSMGWRWVSTDSQRSSVIGGCRAVVELSNELVPLNVEVHSALDGTSVMTRWLQITNAGSTHIALTWVAPWSGHLWCQDADVTAGYSVVQDDQRTGSFGWRKLQRGSTMIQNLHEPCYDDPFFILRNESNGEYFFGQMAWPSLYRMEFERAEHGLSFRIGPVGASGVLRVMAPGETIETPAVHLCHFAGDFDVVVQEMHEHVRRSVLLKCHPDRSHRIEYIANGDTGECLYKGDKFNERNLRACIDVAAEVGAETFIIDGPFWAEPGGRHGYMWEQSSRTLFPNGMRALMDYAHQKGLLFGLYARTEGRDMLTSDGPGMYEYVSRMIEAHGIDLYRHDTSEDQWGDWVHSVRRDGYDECVIWRHYDAFYDAARRLHSAYPHLILQQAAAGGSRSDLATASRWHESFQSDMTGFPLTHRMMAGFSVFLPPEAMQSAYFGMWGDLPPDRETVLRSIFCLGNVPCIYWTLLPGNVNEISPADLAMWRKYVKLYKSFIRPILPSCKVYHHAPINSTCGWDFGHWFAMEYVSADRARAWAVIVSFPGNPSSTYHLVPRGLETDRLYRMTIHNTGKTVTIPGESMQTEGVDVEVGGGSELLLFSALEGKG